MTGQARHEQARQEQEAADREAGFDIIDLRELVTDDELTAVCGGPAEVSVN